MATSSVRTTCEISETEEAQAQVRGLCARARSTTYSLITRWNRLLCMNYNELINTIL